MKKTIYLLSTAVNLLFLSILSTLTSIAQDNSALPEMADVMRSNGKIYVVVAVIVLIFIGILLYLLRLENRMNKLERNSFEK